VLTVKALEVANQTGRELGLRDLARPAMQELVSATGEAAHLSVLDGQDVVTIDQVESTQMLRIYWQIGTRSVAYASASGKALLAAMPDSQLSRHLPERLDATRRTAHQSDFDHEIPDCCATRRNDERQPHLARRGPMTLANAVTSDSGRS
jgi:IclR family acetate operon transcriptional repressor